MEKQVILEVSTELLPPDPDADEWEEPVVVARIYNARLTPATRAHALAMLEHALGFDEPEFTLRETQDPGPEDDEPA